LRRAAEFALIARYAAYCCRSRRKTSPVIQDGGVPTCAEIVPMTPQEILYDSRQR
jgi:hypothetical protein